MKKLNLIILVLSIFLYSGCSKRVYIKPKPYPFKIPKKIEPKKVKLDKNGVNVVIKKEGYIKYIKILRKRSKFMERQIKLYLDLHKKYKKGK